ncbi:agamous-like MADS-box protein AGL80 [Rutidosis leptorrhynchoides]|uniref:agamous-like MADS-box protein AGL80 n=1 Tax=Rutidosis leptorrhynchoides TaxID=125765 RepID=UPI003A98E43A
MTRSPIKYQFLADERVRKVTFKKRKTSLLKKAHELKTLCDVDMCLVMYENDDGPPSVWPSVPEARRVIKRYQGSNLWSANATQDHKSFLERNIAKMKKHLEREREKGLKHSMVKCLFDENAINEIKHENLQSVIDLVDKEIKSIDEVIGRIEEKLKLSL